jgi:hypothetical protein
MVLVAHPSLMTNFSGPKHKQGDIVLLGLRDYQEDKVDIIHKYNADEARNLKAFGELPETGACVPCVPCVQVMREGDGSFAIYLPTTTTTNRPLPSRM